MTFISIPDALHSAVALHQRGERDQAEAFYRRILSLEPRQVDALHLLGTSALQGQAYGIGLTMVARALSVEPDLAAAHSSRALAMLDLGRLAEAVESYRKTLAIAPRSAAAHSNHGLALQEAKRLEEAMISHNRAVAIAPQDGDWLNDRGLTLRAQGRLPAALSTYDRAVALAPGSPRILCNRGAVLSDLTRPTDALLSYDRALAIEPDDILTLRNRAAVLHVLMRLDEGLASCDKALALGSDDPHTLYNRGLLLTELKRFDEALGSYEGALSVRPAYAEAFNNRANVLKELKRIPEALVDYDRALMVREDYAEAHSNKIMVLDLDSDAGFAEHQAARRRWYAMHGRRLAAEVAPHANDRDPSRRIRLGYISADFRNHSAALIFGAILKRHDRRQFEIACYSDVARPDDRTRFFENLADIWRPVRHLSDEALAAQIRADRIDLLVDLAGHSSGNRLRVFARKPAPVQVTGFGYGAGTGIPAIDYLIADPISVPTEVRPLFAEEILDLPFAFTYEAPADAPGVQALPALSRGAVTFGCFNQFTKISRKVLGLWARILQKVSRSRLLLKDPALDDTAVRTFALNALAECGIDPARVVLRGRTSHLKHLKAYGDVDIALDPFPYGGGVTSWEALLMGCPIVTTLSNSVAGRGSGGILSSIGLAEWIADNGDDYVALAVDRSANIEALATLRARLPGMVTGSASGNPDLYTRAVDHAFRNVWRSWCSGSDARQAGPHR